jgi:type VI protein secretion system component Hcp
MRSAGSWRLTALVGAGIAAAAVAAVFALTASGGTSAPTARGITLKLGDGQAFPLTSFTFGGANPTSNTGAIGRAKFKELVFSRATDANIDELLTKLFSVKVIPSAQLVATWGTGETVTYDLANVFVTEFDQEADTGRPADSVKMVFRKLKWKFANASGGSVSGGHDVVTGTTT